MVKIVHIVNIINYLFFILGGFIFTTHIKDFGDLLYYFGITSIIAGIFSICFAFTRNKELRKISLIWFVVNLANIFALIPLIIFLLFFVI